jgi:WhiB family redox-sensing transcriptional regulator
MLDILDTYAPDGTNLAACADDSLDPEWWFDNDEQSRKLAIQICNQCPLRIACGTWALTNKVSDGIWGGLTEAQRKNLRKKR